MTHHERLAALRGRVLLEVPTDGGETLRNADEHSTVAWLHILASRINAEIDAVLARLLAGERVETRYYTRFLEPLPETPDAKPVAQVAAVPEPEGPQIEPTRPRKSRSRGRS